MRLVVFTMVFSGGMIPLFLVVKQLGLLNHYASLILPLAISPFNLILAKNFFQELPDELMEAAKLDGCGEFGVFRRIVLPLSKPIIATISLFHAVGLWNDYMSPLLYINDSSKWTLQVFVRQITSQANVIVNPDPNQVPPGQGIKFAVIIAAMVPVTLVYPFLQKHFAKGVMIGAVKVPCRIMRRCSPNPQRPHRHGAASRAPSCSTCRHTWRKSCANCMPATRRLATWNGQACAPTSNACA